jgi:hypothetical protein
MLPQKKYQCLWPYGSKTNHLVILAGKPRGPKQETWLSHFSVLRQFKIV